MLHKSLLETRKSYLLLSFILLFSLAMRLWKIDFQSLWLDELHTMNEADPDIEWKAMMSYLKCCDQHPPLYFFLARISFEIFGHTAISARIISAIAGTVSVWAMYLLGKEILNRNLGLVVASLTSVNYYNLYYSQEARGYILAFLFSILSFLFLIRLLKKMNIKNTLFYGLFSLLLLYSHYYSLFAVASQVVIIVLLFFISERSERKKYIKYFLISGLIIVLGYIPWLPHLWAMSQIHSFWVQPISLSFLLDFYFEYFGRASVLKQLLIILFCGYLVKVFYSKKSLTPNIATSNPLWFSFIILSIWILVTILIPFLRSLLVVPMILPRYTIVVLPAFLIVLAYAIELINYKFIKFIILFAFIIFSLNNILVVKKYYSIVSKTQFREMTQFVVKNNKENYPIINELVSWHQQYYFKNFKFNPTMLEGKKVSIVDSILNSADPKYHVPGFWIVGAHGEQPLTPEQKKGLDTAYVMTMEHAFYDAWAELYTLKK
ncbi:MAG TPA: glycosyltransferase family 39 protein [Chitinophagaceae bacterium]|nr:glycosyltransferase family 39 protein [Chitinophagaceae bacterium]